MSPSEREFTDDELLAARMHSLGLTGPGIPGAGIASTGVASAGTVSTGVPEPGTAAGSAVDRVTAVVHHLFALQGQDWRSSKWAVGVRAPGLAAADVAAALDEGRIVRSWPMRGTVHLIAAEDIGWIQRLTNPKVLAGAPKRRAFLGMTDADLARAEEVTAAALVGGNSLTRDELAVIWTEAGIDWKSNWRYHLIWWMCQTGLTTFGPVSAPGQAAGGKGDPEPRIVLASEWIARPRALEGDDALLELATRYVRGRGAVTQKDLVAWALIPAADAKRALALALEAGTVARARREGVRGTSGELWIDPIHSEPIHSEPIHHEPRHGDPLEQRPVWHLLPAFDEHLLGYTLREPQLSPEHLARIIPGKNGMFQATIARDGRTVATWCRNPKTNAVEIDPFPGERVDEAAIEEKIAQWALFYGSDKNSTRAA